MAGDLRGSSRIGDHWGQRDPAREPPLRALGDLLARSLVLAAGVVTLIASSFVGGIAGVAILGAFALAAALITWER